MRIVHQCLCPHVVALSRCHSQLITEHIQVGYFQYRVTTQDLIGPSLTPDYVPIILHELFETI